MSNIDEIQNRADLMKDAAKKAGLVIADPNWQRVKEHKTGNQDISTTGDIESERLIMELIRANFPGDKIMSEEGSPEDQIKGFEGFVWVIDPIDGTINYARGRRSSAVSIGLIKNEEVVAGAVYNPYADELFRAVRGKGAFVNDNKIHVSDVGTFDKALCLTDNGYAADVIRKNLELLLAIPEFERLGVTGSAVLHYTEIASGRADFYLHTTLKPWDNAAGFILVEEAGGILRDLKGEEVTILTEEVIAGNKDIINNYLGGKKPAPSDTLMY